MGGPTMPAAPNPLELVAIDRAAPVRIPAGAAGGAS
jgi:hypothetical protein